MTFLSRAALSALAVAAAAAAAWTLLGRGSGPSTPPAPTPVEPRRPEPDETARRPLDAEGAGDPREAATSPPPRPLEGSPAPGAVSPGLRTPSGEDLSDPRTAKEKLRALLAADPPDWEEVARVAAVIPGHLDPDVRRALVAALAERRDAGALRVFASVRDPDVVDDLLDALSTRGLRPVDRTNVLEALASLPEADRDAVVRGIEARLSGDPVLDASALRAVARRGGAEAVRVLVDATAKWPGQVGLSTWRELDVSRDAAAAERLAEALRDGARDPATRRVLAEGAGRPGAPAAVVDALRALDDPAAPPELRDEALRALARTGTPSAVEHLLAGAAAGGERGEAAARALSEVSGARGEAAERLVRAASEATDPGLRRHVAHALGGVGSPAASAALETLLVDADDLVRKEAVVALGRHGPRAAGVVPALSRAFDAGDDVTKGHVALTLAAIGTPEARRTLEQMRTVAASPGVRRQVALAIESLGRR